ncbi:integrase core domain protein [Ancylostoma caninum]|uniref:Integrase core domain protein n=1 Tax=Ancylostoma caninum TaxID=29170 RepID=A0A368FAW4_ANCCA|nr:integrase core domain protein [Ancylostoma caninum]
MSTKPVACQIRYVPTDSNPADCATRGIPSKDFSSHIWWKGPQFLSQQEETWSLNTPFSITIDTTREPEPETIPTELLEIERLFKSNQTNGSEINVDPCEETPKRNGRKGTVVNHITTEKSQTMTLPLMSSWLQTKRAMAIVLKFIKVKILKNVSNHNKNKLQESIPELSIDIAFPLNEPTPKDLQAAEKCLIRMAQNQHILKSNKYTNLNVILEPDGILRCYGRLQNSELPEETKYPILLPPNHDITKLIIRDYHQKIGHQGVNGTLANIRTKYWIPTGRQAVRKVLNSCMICKKWNAKPYLYPDSPSLPRVRSTRSRPFENVGIDFAGPFLVRTSPDITAKVWICLFSCMVTRAVHLELVEGLSAEAFVNSLRRFVARRGAPTAIVSDNATNFKLAHEILLEQSNHNNIINSNNQINTFLSQNQIQWKFITPLSPWKGGFYERLVGMMKMCLRKLIGRRTLSMTNFQTLMTEIEAMINSRPLAYSGSTIDDSLVIRPIDFLIPQAKLGLLPEKEHDENDNDYTPTITTKTDSIQHLSETNNYLTKLWTMWREQYLLELRNLHEKRIRQRSFTRKTPKIGEVVLIMDNDVSRGSWPMGIVTTLLKGPDEEIREVELRTANREHIKRSINMLVPLELDTYTHDSYDCASHSRNEDQLAAANNTGSSSKSKNSQIREILPRRAKENYNNITLSQVKITLNEVVLRCNKETLYYTRNTETRVQYSKRCPHMGSCKGAKCAEITPNTLVKELNIANKFTGITYCTESCGGLGCSCGFPSSGCLFYRVYQVPLDHDIYEVFHCPTWTERAAVQFETTSWLQKRRTYRVELKPNVQKKLEDMYFELTSVAIPPLPILSETFLSSSTLVAKVAKGHSFSYACLGQDQVTTRRTNKSTIERCSIKDTCHSGSMEETDNKPRAESQIDSENPQQDSETPATNAVNPTDQQPNCLSPPVTVASPPGLMLPPQLGYGQPTIICPAMKTLHATLSSLHKDIIDLKKEVRMHRGAVEFLAEHMEACVNTAIKPEQVHAAVQAEEHPPPPADESSPNQQQPSDKPSSLSSSPPSCCVFCGAEHWATNCDIYPTLTSRRRSLMHQNRCERCLGPANHMVTACQPRSNCFYCKQAKRCFEMIKHHSTFCPYQFKM